jgi:uncharacterized protein YejL (UPF0352 family)
VDATDYYDGFGTGEVVLGIRAYQWGWEYYFPKNIDLNYDMTQSFAPIVGNSLKYSKYSTSANTSNFFLNNMNYSSGTSRTSSPTHAILSPTDNSKILNFINFNNLGINTSKGSVAFKQIQLSSKANPGTLFSTNTDYSITYSKLTDLYLTDLLTQSNISYGTIRQHNFTLPKSSNISSKATLDKKTVDYLISFNNNVSEINNTSLNLNNHNLLNTNNLSNITDLHLSVLGNLKFNLTVENLGKGQISVINNKDSISDCLTSDNPTPNLHLSNNSFNKLLMWTKLRLNSPDQQLLSNEKNIRNISNIGNNNFNSAFYKPSNDSNILKQTNPLNDTVLKASTRFELSH